MLEDLRIANEILDYLKYRAVRCSLAEITRGINDKEKPRIPDLTPSTYAIG